MALNIKRPETERIVRRMSQRTGLSVTKTVEEAVTRWEADLDRENGSERKLREFREWQRSFGPRPPGPGLEEIMDDMYDERGLPR